MQEYPPTNNFNKHFKEALPTLAERIASCPPVKKRGMCPELCISAKEEESPITTKHVLELCILAKEERPTTTKHVPELCISAKEERLATMDCVCA